MATFIFLNGGAALAAILSAVATHGPRTTAEILFAAICAYAVIVHTAMLVSGIAGWLTAGGAAVLVAVAVAVAGRAAVRGRGAPLPPAAVSGFTAATLYAAFSAAVAGGAWTWPHLFEA